MSCMNTKEFIETIESILNSGGESANGMFGANGSDDSESATAGHSMRAEQQSAVAPVNGFAAKNRPVSSMMNGHSNQANGKGLHSKSACEVIVLSSSDEDESDLVSPSKRRKLCQSDLTVTDNTQKPMDTTKTSPKLATAAIQVNGFAAELRPLPFLEPEVVLTIDGKVQNEHATSPNKRQTVLVSPSSKATAETKPSTSPSSLSVAVSPLRRNVKLIVKKSGVPNRVNVTKVVEQKLALAAKSTAVPSSTIGDEPAEMASAAVTTATTSLPSPRAATVDNSQYSLPPTSLKRTTMRKTGVKQDSKSTIKKDDIEVLSVSSSDDDDESDRKSQTRNKDNKVVEEAEKEDWRSTVFDISDNEDEDDDDKDDKNDTAKVKVKATVPKTSSDASREQIKVLFDKENKNIFLMCDKQFPSLKIKMKTNWMVLSDSNFYLEKKGFYNKMSEFNDLKFSHLFHWVLTKNLFYLKDNFRIPKFVMLKNSVFDLGKSPKVVLELISHWVLQTEASIVTKKLNVDMEYLRGFYQTLRAVCTLSLTYKKFASKKDVVELGVISLQAHYKSHAKRNTMLIVGAYNVSRKTFRYFLLSNTTANADLSLTGTNVNAANQMGNSNMPALKSILECWFEKTCVIFMDDRLNRSLLRGYNVFSEQKNPSKNYNIKHSLERRLILLFQGKMHTLDNSLIQQFLDELAWRDEFGRSYDDLLKSIIECIQFQTKKYANKNFTMFLNNVAKSPQEFLVQPNFNVTDKYPRQKESDQNSYVSIKCVESCAEKPVEQALLHSQLLHQQQLHPQRSVMAAGGAAALTAATNGPRNRMTTAAAAAATTGRKGAAPVTRSSQRGSSCSSTNSSSSAVSTTAGASRVMPSRAVNNNKCDNEQKKLQTARHLLLKKKTLQPLLTRSATLNSVENAKCMEKAFFGYKFGRRSEVFSKSDQVFSCGECKRSFTDNVKFLDHLNATIFKSHNETELILCRYCLNRFNSLTELKRHIDTKHPLTILGPEDSFSCPICETVYSTMLEIRSHLNDSHPPYELPYKCHVCSFMCYSHRLAVDHFYFEHKGFSLIQCPLCLYCVSFRRENVFNSFKHEVELYTSHIRAHLTNVPFKCRQCVLTFISSEEVSKHIQQEHAEAHKDVVQFNNFQNWVIQNLLCFECNESLFLNMNHLKVPSKCQKCKYETNCRKAFSLHKCQRPLQLPMEDEMFCLCGFKSSDGFELAKHLVGCEHKTVYRSPSDAEFILSGGSYLVSLGLKRTDKR